MSNLSTTIKKHPRHTFALLGIGIIFMLLFQFHLGFHWGPHKVAPGETLSGLMTDAFQGDRFLTFNAVNNIRPYLNVDRLWSNTGGDVRNGDVVSVRGNELIIKKPNDQVLRATLFSQNAYAKRIAEVVAWDLALLAIVLSLVTLVVHHGQNKLQAVFPLQLNLGSGKLLLWLVLIPCAFMVFFLLFIAAARIVLVSSGPALYSSSTSISFVIENLLFFVLPVGLAIGTFFFFKFLRKHLTSSRVIVILSLLVFFEILCILEIVYLFLRL